VKKIIIYAIVIIGVILAFLGIKKLLKLNALKTAKIGVNGFKVLDKITAQTFTSGLNTELDLKLQNYSNNTYELEQLQVDLYTPSGVLIAEQVSPLQPTTINPSANNSIKVNHNINSEGFVKLLRESKLVNLDDKVWEIALQVLTLDLSGIHLVAKGFAKIDGVQVSFNETFTL